jgi:hypothetical protein
MKNEVITEFVKFKVLETTTVEQLLSKADILNEFQKKLDGYIDAELVKGIEGNAWCFIYHFDSLEKVKVIGEKLRGSNVFSEFICLIIPESLNVTLNHQFKKW